MLLPHFDGAQVLLKIWFLTHFVRVRLWWDAAAFYEVHVADGTLPAWSAVHFKCSILKSGVRCCCLFLDLNWSLTTKPKKKNSLIWHFYNENWSKGPTEWKKKKLFYRPSSVVTRRRLVGGRMSWLIVQHTELLCFFCFFGVCFVNRGRRHLLVPLLLLRWTTSKSPKCHRGKP